VEDGLNEPQPLTGRQLQLTPAAAGSLETIALIDIFWLGWMAVGVVGLMVAESPLALMVTVKLAVCLVSWSEAAVMVSFPSLGAAAGAV
jgi:hypothetical protein